METRELRYFVAVAEELHVGRAAERLGMAQPPLSRAIAQLERRLGGDLFVRTPRGVELTAAGTVLLGEARAALVAVDAADRRTRRALGAGDRPSVVLAAKAGASSELMAKLLDAHAAEPGATDVDLLLCGPGEQAVVLRDGRADVALLHLPFDDVTGLDTEELGSEGQVLVLQAGHPLSTRSHVTLADVDGLPLPRWPDPCGAGGASPGPSTAPAPPRRRAGGVAVARRTPVQHRSGALPSHHRDDAGIRRGPGATPHADGDGVEVRDHTQLLQLIGLGRTVAVLPESVRSGLREGLVVVPVVDAPQVTTVIAWPPQSRSTAVAALVRTATRL